MSSKLKKLLIKIIIAALLFTLSYWPQPLASKLSLLGIAYAVVGWPIIKKSLRSMGRGQVFDENFLMTVATFGAFALKEYAEGVAVMLFFQIGEFFQSYAVNRSRKSIAALMNIRPDFARVKRGKDWLEVAPDEVKTGEVIQVRSGEKIPLDGVVVKGQSAVDTAALTGESVPTEVCKGAVVMSGCVNLSGVLELKVTKPYGESTVAKILDLVENASVKKASMENFITRFARWYTPTVVCVAALLACLPPILIAGAAWADWGYRALTFLVISCPCALVISVPLSFFGGIGAASRCGVLVKGANYLEALAHAETVVFDKTGTLTEGKFRVFELHPEGISADRLLETAAHLEAYSSHPIAQSITEAYGKTADTNRLKKVKELFGVGITAELDGIKTAVGNAKILALYKLPLPQEQKSGTMVYVVINSRYAGYILITDRIKEDTVQALQDLKKEGVGQMVMLTGDSKAPARHIAKILKLDKYFAELMPADKVKKVEHLLKAKSPQGKLLFVGDGINDAPVLARADVGIAMGGVGSDAAIEAADAVIMTDEPSKIVTALRIAKRTVWIAKENVVFAISVKLLVLGMGAAGFASIWAAVFADVGVSVIAVLNAVRALGLYKKC